MVVVVVVATIVMLFLQSEAFQAEVLGEEGFEGFKSTANSNHEEVIQNH